MNNCKNAGLEVQIGGLESFMKPVLYSDFMNEGISELNAAIAVHERACVMLKSGANLVDVEERLDLELVMLIEILRRSPNLEKAFSHLDETRQRYAIGRLEVAFTFADRINEICFGDGEYSTWVEAYCEIIKNIVTRGEAVAAAGDYVEAASLVALAREKLGNLLEVAIHFSATGLGRFPANIIELCFDLDEFPNHQESTAPLSDRVERLRRQIPTVPRMQGALPEYLREYVGRLIPGHAARLRH